MAMKGTSFFPVTGCGGGGKIEPSLYALNIDGDTFLLDVGYERGTSKPIKEVLNELRLLNPRPSGILISHAHKDHLGLLLPVLHFTNSFCKVPIVMTPPTWIFAKSMLKDALKLDADSKLKKYGCSDSSIDKTLAFCTTKDIGQSIKIDNTEITLLPAGHIPGAAGFLLKGQNGTKVLYTGDFSLSDFYTVSGAKFSVEGPLDLLITETTYASKKNHGPREEEVKAFINDMADALEKKGVVLIPSFSLGRAQEILAILLRAMGTDRFPTELKLYLAGMAAEITEAYAELSENYCPKWFRDKFNELSESGLEENPKKPIRLLDIERDRIEAETYTGPAVFLASSGNLKGGPSEGFACWLLPKPETTVFVVGHQDGESPGRRLEEIMDAKKTNSTVLLTDSFEEQLLGFRGRPKFRQRISRTIPIPVRCKILKHKLSAHCDDSELISIFSRTKPERAILVHCPSSEDRKKLARRIRKKLKCKVFVPINGKEIKPNNCPGITVFRKESKVKEFPAVVEIVAPPKQLSTNIELSRMRKCPVCGENKADFFRCDICGRDVCVTCWDRNGQYCLDRINCMDAVQKKEDEEESVDNDEKANVRKEDYITHEVENEKNRYIHLVA